MSRMSGLYAAECPTPFEFGCGWAAPFGSTPNPLSCDGVLAQIRIFHDQPARGPLASCGHSGCTLAVIAPVPGPLEEPSSGNWPAPKWSLSHVARSFSRTVPRLPALPRPDGPRHRLRSRRGVLRPAL
ncbi:hypothetical protein EHH54_37660 [Rhizobium leguminosarum]|nr:hypothetical protein EHH54_37660 [Rhizobium leguminosarum]